MEIVSTNLRRIAADHGPEAVVFSTASPSTSALSDSLDRIMRLRRAYGIPNQVNSMELCGWGRYLATTYMFGASVPGVYMPDLEQTGCMLFWGYNPSLARVVHATAALAALNRGAKLVVVDPKRVGLACRATQWVGIRPGTDTALALSIAQVMIARGWFGRDFVRDWTNAAYLVRQDNGRLLRAVDLDPTEAAGSFFVWDAAPGGPVVVDTWNGNPQPNAALSGRFEPATSDGPIPCRPVFELLEDMCAPYVPEKAEAITGIAAAEIRPRRSFCGKTDPSPIMPGAGSSSTPTPPRLPVPLPSFAS